MDNLTDKEIIELQKKELQRRGELIDSLSVANLKLANAIRKHREQTGNNMCWENDEELWAVLEDGVKIDHTAPPWPEFMTKCAAYRASKDNPRCANVNWKLVEEMFGNEAKWKK